MNFIATIIQLRAKGMTWMRLPFFVWAQFVTAFLLLLAFPPLEAADRHAADGSRGGDELLPAERSGRERRAAAHQRRRQPASLAASVLVPRASGSLRADSAGMGIVAEIIANNTRKPLWGYKSLVFAVLVLGFLSFIVWAHHMWLTGMGTAVSAFFQTTTMIISIPSVIILSAFFISLWGGSIRFNVPMLFATAFLPMFGIGGLTGIPLAFNSRRSLPARHLLRHRAFPLHRRAGHDLRALRRDLLLVPESDRAHDERILGQGAFLAFAHLHERDFPADVPAGNARHASPLVRWRPGLEPRQRKGLGPDRIPMEHADLDRGLGAWAWRRFRSSSISSGASSTARKSNDNPWEATTLEWTAPSPPPHGNFVDHAGGLSRALRIQPARAARRDFTMQNEPVEPTSDRAADASAAASSLHCTNESANMEIPYTVTARPDTGLWNAKVGIWLFLASEVMLFGGLFSAYIFLRLDAEPGFWPHGLLNVPVGTMNTAILIASSVTVVLAWAALKMRQFTRYKVYMGITILCGVIFLVVKLAYEWPQKFEHFGAYH